MRSKPLAAVVATIVAFAFLAWWTFTPDRPAKPPRSTAQEPGAWLSHALPAQEPSFVRSALIGLRSVMADDKKPIDVCGIVRLDGPPDPLQLPPPPEVMARVDREAEALVDRIEADGDPFARAIGRIVRGQAKADAASQPETASAPAPASQPTAVAVNPTLEAIAADARTTSDPRLYALAFKMCRYGHAPSCSQLSLQQWARVDPDNAEPWFFVLGEAASRQDAAGTADALFHMGASKRYDNHYAAPMGVVVDHADLTSDYGILATTGVLVMVVGIQAAEALPQLRDLAKACDATAIADTNRRQLCEQVAALLADHSDTLLMTGVGERMGKRLGWSEDRVAAIKAFELAGFDAMTPLPPASAASSCDPLKSFADRQQQFAIMGEANWARERLRLSANASSYLERARAREHKVDAYERERAAASAASAVR